MSILFQKTHNLWLNFIFRCHFYDINLISRPLWYFGVVQIIKLFVRRMVISIVNQKYCTKIINMSNYSTNWLIYRSHCIICRPFKPFFFRDIIFLPENQFLFFNTCVGYTDHNHCSCHLIREIIPFRYFTSTDWKYYLTALHILWITKVFMWLHNYFKFQIFSWFFLNYLIESYIIIIPVFYILFHNRVAREEHKDPRRPYRLRNCFYKFSKFRDHIFIISIISIKSKLNIFKTMNWLYHNLIFLNDMIEFFLNFKRNPKFLLNQYHWWKCTRTHYNRMWLFLLDWIKAYLWAEALNGKYSFSQFIKSIIFFII